MSIMAISNNSSNTSNALGSNSNSQIEALQKMKENLTSRLQKVKSSDEDDAIKQTEIQAISEQISVVETQIQEAKYKDKQEEVQKTSNKGEQTTQNQNQDQYGGVVVSGSLVKALASMQNNLSQSNEVNKVQSELKGEKSVAESQVSTGIENSHEGCTYSIDYQSNTVNKDSISLYKATENLNEINDSMNNDMKEIKNSSATVNQNSDNNDKEDEKSLVDADDEINSETNASVDVKV